MTEPKPEYTHTFAVETGNYGDFIRWVRRDVCEHCDQKRPNDIPPVLPPQKDVPNLWLHIVLRTKTSILTLAIRVDNLYLVGFKTPAGVWWEFGKEGETRLIRNSQWLGFGGRYQDLVGQKGLETITLGRAEMITAVDFLAKHGSEQVLKAAQGVDAYAQPKTMLAKLVIMICEGLRFHTVYNTLDKEFNNPVAKITQLDGKQVLRWDRISKAILKWAVDPNADPQLDQELGIKNRIDGAKVIALVKNETN